MHLYETAPAPVEQPNFSVIIRNEKVTFELHTGREMNPLSNSLLFIAFLVFSLSANKAITEKLSQCFCRKVQALSFSASLTEAVNVVGGRKQS